MKHVELEIANGDQFRQRQRHRPRTRVNVAANRQRRRDGAKPFEDFGVADIAGVDDQLTVLQRNDRLGPKQAVRIRDDAHRHVCHIPSRLGVKPPRQCILLRMPTPDLQPTLIGPRIIVRPIALTDWDEMFAAAADPEVWALHPVRERYKAEVFREFFDGALKSGAAFSFVDRGKARRSSARAAITATTRSKREIEIGWTFIARAHWGGSINAEVKRLMLDHAFSSATRWSSGSAKPVGARNAPWRK